MSRRAGTQPGFPAWGVMLAITAAAALLRLARLGLSPPGFNQDEAINAWNAWCLLGTGHDMTGASWPVFYSHAVGDNRTTLFFYLLMPFQALFGLSAWSGRLPAAVLGTLSVPLAGYVAARWWGRGAGWIAAALLAIDPWHLFLSRIALEGSVTPFLALAPLALLVAARLLPGDSDLAGANATRGAPAAPRWPLALAAGLVAGVVTYGYWPMRLWIPAWLIVTALLAGPRVWRDWRRGPALRAWLAFFAGLAATFGPLLVRHIVDPAIAQRATMTRLWEPGTPPLEIAGRILERWGIHYGPGFLFVGGDTYELLRPAVDGAMHRFMLPLFLAGLIAIAARFRRSVAARWLLALVIVYPAGDLIARYDGVHALRSAPGIGGLVLLAALGAVACGEWLARRGRTLARGAAVAFAALALAFAVRSCWVFYGEFNRQRDVYGSYQTELYEAGRWLAPRLEKADAVFVTTNFLLQPWSTLLVGLDYPARRWFAEPRDRIRAGAWDEYRRIGKLVFMHDPSARRDAEALEANGRPDRVYFVVRPGEMGLRDPVFVVRLRGEERMWVCEVTL